MSDDEIRKRIAQRITWAREGRGWAQTELDRRLGLEPGNVKQFETGDRGFSTERLRAIELALGVSQGFISAGNAQERDVELVAVGARRGGWKSAMRAVRAALAPLREPADLRADVPTAPVEKFEAVGKGAGKGKRRRAG